MFALGAVALWGAVPAGFLLDLHPLATGVAAGLGCIAGSVAVLAFGVPLRTWIVGRLGARGGKPLNDRLVYRVWRRYGVAGLGLLSPLITGSQLGVALGLTFGAPAGRLLFWTVLGIVLWSALLTAAGVMWLGGVKA